MGNDCFSCCRCLISQHSPSSSSPPLWLSALTPCPAPPLYNKRRSAGTAALLTDLLLPPAATLFKPFVLLRKKKKTTTTRFEVRKYNMSKNIERKIKWALEEGFLSQLCSLSPISQDYWFFRGGTRKIEEKRNQGLIRRAATALWQRKEGEGPFWDTQSHKLLCKAPEPRKRAFLGETCTRSHFLLCFSGPKKTFYLQREKLKIRHIHGAWSVFTLTSYSDFSEWPVFRYEMVESFILYRWRVPNFFNKVFFMLLLFTEPILQFPQGSKNRSTTCLLRMRTHFKVADVKITYNHKKCQFSDSEAADNVTEYYSCSKEARISKYLHPHRTIQAIHKPNTKNNKPSETPSSNRWNSDLSQIHSCADFPHFTHKKAGAYAHGNVSVFCIRFGCFSLFSNLLFYSFI